MMSLTGTGVSVCHTRRLFFYAIFFVKSMAASSLEDAAMLFFLSRNQLLACDVVRHRQ